MDHTGVGWILAGVWMRNNSRILRSPHLREFWFSLWSAFQYFGSTNECSKSKCISNINDVSMCLPFNAKQCIAFSSDFIFFNRFCTLTGISRRPPSNINILRMLSSLPVFIPATQWVTVMVKLVENPSRKFQLQAPLMPFGLVCLFNS